MRLGQEVQALPRRLRSDRPYAPRNGATDLGPRARALLLLVAALAAFLLLGLGYDHEPLATIDAEVSQWVAANMPIAFEWFARPFSWIGGWIGLTVVSVALVAVLAGARRPWDALWSAATIVLAQVAVTPFLKEAYDRPRPAAGSAVPLPSSDAYPSGHAASAAATCGVLAVLAAERWPDRRRAIWAAAAVLAFAIGVSRVLLNVHFLTDVLAGWCFGIACVAAAVLVRSGFVAGPIPVRPERVSRGS